MSAIVPGAKGLDPYADWDAAYVLDALSGADTVLYEDHLRQCPACRDAVAELSGVPELLARIPADDAPALADAQEPQESHDIMGAMSSRSNKSRSRKTSTPRASGSSARPGNTQRSGGKGKNSRPSGSKGGHAKNTRPPGPKGGAARSARARLAEQRRQQERRRRLGLMVGLPVAVVLLAVVAMVGVRLLRSGNNEEATGQPSDPAGVAKVVASVPPDVLNQVGVGTAKNMPEPVQAPPLTVDGKPKVLYIGAEYCPYCASERWAVVVALSRFGSFSDLGLAKSSSTDVYPNTATLSFHGASYSSDTVAFTGVETQDRQGNPLDQPSAEDQQIFSTYDFPPYVQGQGGSIPFVDIGGTYLIHGASYDPQVLKGKSHAEIAQALHDPSSPIAQGVDGTANLITAAICATMDDPPADVCESPGVQAAAKKLQS